MNGEDRKYLEEAYLKLGKFEIECIMLDSIYDEQKEIDFIKKAFKEWQEIKKKFSMTLKNLIEGIEKKGEKKERGYLG